MGGELVFVTGINHARDEANLLRLLQEGHQSGIAGMVILTGEAFIHAIPDSVVAQADVLGIPLIEQPYMLKMVIVTQLVGTALVQRDSLLRSQREILAQLLTGDYPSIELKRQRASHLQLTLNRPHRVITLRLSGIPALFDNHPPDSAEAQLQTARQALEERLAAQPASLPLVTLGELFILFWPEDDAAFLDGKAWLGEMLQSLSTSLQPLTLFCGLSYTVTQAHHYRRGLGEARRALEVAESMRPDKGICDFSALGVLQLLTAIPDQELVNRFMKETLGPLFAANRKHPALLIDTLEAILQENGNVIKAAERLGIHRNTLNQRLQRIERQFDHRVNDPQWRLNVSVALLIWRMSHAQQQEFL